MIANVLKRSTFRWLTEHVWPTCSAALALAGLAVATSSSARADHATPAKPDESPPPLMEGLGDVEHPITTNNPTAQQYFNQGLRLMYAFNHDEAIRAFRAAARLDPECAMAQWGIALALGPNYNLEAEKERSIGAWAALEQARQLVGKATPVEKAYIEALATRYVADPEADRKPLDAAYAQAMRKLSADNPNDLDAAVLFAESLMDLHPWDLWSPEGRPQSNTEEIVATLEGVLQKNPRHTGANHFYIHAVEASLQPERALEAAKRLGGLAPNAGHLVHMPSHIFFRVGMYEEAAESNAQAIVVDRKYIAANKPTGPYPMMYYPHNIHFLWAARAMQGRSAESIRSASEVVEMLPPEMVREMPMIEYFMPTRLYALIRFEKWDEILKEPKPAAEFKLATGMWHYARGKAFAAQHQAAAARQEQVGLQQALAATPQDQLAMRHSVVRLLGLASRDLAAAVSAADGDIDAAISQLRVAVVLQDGLLYDEPPAWFQSERESLGRLLLKANRASESELLFREDLRRQPGNGWALEGLERSLRALKRPSEADEVQKEFAKAWAGADYQIR